MNRSCFCSILLLLCSVSYCQCSDNASQLYEDLMYNYIRAVRPVRNVTDPVVVKFGSSLIRIIEIDEKNQIFTTNLWLELQWVDSSLIWDPDNYNVKKLHIPADQIWLPDIVLYNNAAGNPEISIYTDALIHYDGTVVWKPPAIYKSFCEIDVTYFPYDEQNCFMKFGLWTHTGDVVDLKLLPEDQVTRVKDEHLHPEENLTVDFLQAGMDLSYYYINNEWDLVSLTCQRNEQLYGTCCGQDYYIDVTYYFQLRRKPLFYTVNLIVPCALISFLTTFVFYVPADAMGHQMTFSICILVTLTVFFLVLIDLIPPTSKVIPLFGSYLIFTLVLVTFSIIISVICLNLYHRSGATHIMPRWVRVVFIETLPKYFFIERPNASSGGEENSSKKSTSSEVTKSSAADLVQKPISFDDREHSPFITRRNESYQQYRRRVHAQMIIGVIKKVQFIANHFKQLEEEENVANDWKFVAMVIDRIFFLLFSVVNVLGTLLIILWAPTLYGVHHHVTLPNATKPLGGDTLRSAFTST